MAKDNCFIDIKLNEVSDAIKEKFGPMKDKAVMCVEYIMPDGEITQEFKDWYKRKTKHDLKINKRNKSSIAQRAYQYYLESAWKIDDMTEETNDTRGYYSINDIEKGKAHIVDCMLDLYNDMSAGVISNELEDNNFIRNEIRRRWNRHIFRLIASKTGKTEEDVRAEFNALTENDIPREWIKDNLSEGDFGIVEQNLLAVWDDLNADDEWVNDYLRKCLANIKLKGLFNNNFDEEEKQEQKDLNGTETVASTEEEGSTPQEATNEVDESMKNYNMHLGDYGNFLDHLSDELRNYFNSLRKLYSTDTANGYVEDTNNTFGIAETMDAEECAKALFAESINFNNPEQLIKCVENIANRVPGFECFIKFRDDLRTNPELVNQVFSVFARTRVSKVTIEHKTVGQTKKNEVKESNLDSDKSASMMFDLRNDIRFAVSQYEPTAIEERLKDYVYRRGSKSKLDSLEDRIKDGITEKLEEEYLTALNDIINIIRTYFPSIDEKSIKSYVSKHNDARENRIENIKNLKTLIDKFSNIVTATKKCKTKWNGIQTELNNAIAKNDKLKNSKINVSRSQYEDVNEIRSQDFIADAENSIQLFKNSLIDYSFVKTNNNSVNAENKMSSDILNNSTITRLIKILESGDTELVEIWGKNKLRSHQYKYSNIFIEDKAIGRFGLFEKTNDGSIKCTPYALDMLKLLLFDGGKNLDNGKSATYSKMNNGSFGPSVYAAFFGSNFKINKNSSGNTLNTAMYFLRTPSDAPKTFVLRGPRYDCSTLYSYPNQEIVDSFISNIFNSIPRITEQKALEHNLINKFDILRTSRYSYSPQKIVDAIIGKTDNRGNVEKIFIDDRNSWTDGEDTYCVVNVTVKNDVLGTILILKGRPEEIGNRKALTNLTIDSYINYHKTLGKEFPEMLSKRLTNYYKTKMDNGDTVYNGVEYSNIPKRTINRSHVTYNMLFNKVKQELFDMMNAIDFMFETNADGSPVTIKDEHGNIVFKLKEGFDIDSAYNYYHKKFNDKTNKDEIFKIVDGHAVLVGNVFNSNIMTLMVDNPNKETAKDNPKIIRNYLMEVITQDMNYDEHPDIDADGNKVDKLYFSYGGADGDSNVKVSKPTPDKNNSQTNTYPEELKLNKKQEDILKGAMDRFLIDYLKQQKENIDNIKQFIVEDTSENSINEYAMNYLLMMYAYDELFEGSTKFYKDGRTILKRAKEYQGSGIPLGLSDYYASDSEIGTEMPSLLNSGSIFEPEVDKDSNPVLDDNGKQKIKEIPGKDIFKGTRLEGLNTTNSFKAVTIFNTIRTNHPALKTLKDKLIKLGVDEDDAQQILYGKVSTNEQGETELDENGNIISKGGFTGTKVNDAQSYITFEEWICRVAGKGQLKKYLPLIRRILAAEKSGKNISPEDIKEFIQVQKNFYFDLHYDDKTRMEAPRQIKNAELVLIPALIKGTELEEVYNLMKECGIDQLNTIETSKAANHNVLTLWNNDGIITKENYNNFKANAGKAIEYFNYKYLYTQQETPQHMNAFNKAGSQIIKKIIDNIAESTNDPIVVKAKNDFENLMYDNIYDSYEQIVDELELKYDENGDIESINKKVFFEKLRQQLELRGMDDNMYDFVDIDDSGNPRMPIIRNDILNTFESIIQSVFNNNITRQKLPGFHAAQVTNVGWRAGGSLKAERLTDEQLRKDADFIEFSNDPKYAKFVKVSKNKISDGIRKMFGDWLNNKINAKFSYNSDLNYHQDKDGNYSPYIEIKLPLSYLGIDRTKGRWRNMKDSEILEELHAEGLDIVIGYRIPTEGKQSACLMKIVGFPSDAEGSTIVVPDDWVSQTGSDFDIDSVYGIQFNTYFDSDGKIHRIVYDENKEPNYVDYYKYVVRAIEEGVLPDNASDDIKNKRNALKESRNKKFEDLNNVYGEAVNAFRPTVLKAESDELYEESEIEEDDDKSQELYDKSEVLLSLVEDSTIKKIVDNMSSIKKQLKNDTNLTTKQDKSREKAIRYKNMFTEVKEELLKNNNETKEDNDKNNELIRRLDNAINAAAKLINHYDYTSDIPVSEEAAMQFIDENESNIEGSGILSYDDWADLPAERRASRKERDNGILMAMQTILKSDESLEEQLMRSNFDDITDALRDMMSAEQKLQFVARSPYNISDQIAYQDEVTSGANLKALSVSLDTFCSVCNNAQARINDKQAIYIIYDRGDIKNVDKVIDRYNVDGEHAKKLKEDGSSFSIRHTTYGWTKDFKNVAGKILTSYSAETTALSLDAVKEGSVPNVNDFTFGVYKTLANMGVDFRTIVSFMLQPGITKLVEKYKAGNSLYYDMYGTPLNEAIKDIATGLGIKYQKTDSITSILASIREKHGEQFKKIYGDNANIGLNENSLINLPIIASKCRDRVKGIGTFKNSSPVEELLFDLGVILQFHKINTLANDINPIRKACTTDKFGAGKSAYAAHKFMLDIYKAISSKDAYAKGLDKNPVMTGKNGKHILEEIYPGIADYIDDESLKPYQRILKAVQKSDMRNSTYKVLAANLKFGTAFSLIVGSELIPTENPAFVEAVMGIGDNLSNNFIGDISDELYNDLQKYLLNYIYNNIPTISDELIYKVKDGKLVGVDVNDKCDRDDENARIFGYGCPNVIGYYEGSGRDKKFVPFVVKDKNNPNQDEINAFAKLSPAQKVKWIKNNSIDAGIFEYLEPNLYNPIARKEKIGMQTIQFNDNGFNMNTIRMQFMNAVNSINPFVKMTALDLVKYSVKTEGLRLGKSSVSKVIDNDVLINDFGPIGYGFVESVIAEFNNISSIGSILDKTNLDEAYERFLRSKQDLKEIKTFNTYGREKKGIIAGVKGIYLSVFNFNPDDVKEGETELEAKDRQYRDWKENLVENGFFKKDGKTHIISKNEYIRIKDKDRGNLLYKIKYNAGDSIMACYPLPNLQSNETSKWSANEDNNTDIWSKEQYEMVLDLVYKEGYDRTRMYNIVAELRETDDFKQYYHETKKGLSNPETRQSELQKAINSKNNLSLNIVRHEIENAVNHGFNEPIYVISSALNDYLFKKGSNYDAHIRVKLDKNNLDKLVEIDVVDIRISKESETVRDSITGSKKYTKLDKNVSKKLGDKLNKGNEDYVYKITRETPSELINDGNSQAASIVDLNYDAVQFMKSQKAAFGDEDAIRRLETLKVFDIKTRISSIQNNTTLVTQQVASFANAVSKKLVNKFYNFMPNPDNTDEWLPITDDRVQKALIGDERLLKDYQKLILDIQAFKNRFDGWEQADSNDDSIKTYIDTINEAKKLISKLPVDEADRKLIEGYLTESSTNPLVKEGLVHIMDGYYKTRGSMWAFNDILENGNILLQTILKDVMGDIEAKRIHAMNARRKFESDLNKLLAKCKELGYDVDIDKLIDENGRWVEDYSPEFIDKLEEYRDARDEAAKNGFGNIEHLKAKNQYDAFKAFYCNQEADPKYYQKKVVLERKMIDDYPDVYSKYMTLYYRKMSLLNYTTDVGTNKAVEDEIQNIDEELYNLQRFGSYVDEKGNHKSRRYKAAILADSTLTDEEKKKELAYSIEAQQALYNYTKEIKQLNDEYFEYTPAVGFEKKLKEVLNIIESFEKRDANGLPTVPQNILDANEQYNNARTWLRKNAYFALNSEGTQPFEKQVQQALKRLATAKNGKTYDVNRIIKEAEDRLKALGQSLRDPDGVVDASKLTDSEREAIFNEMYSKYYKRTNFSNKTYSDRIIINSAPRIDEVYTGEFYDPMKTNGSHSARWEEVATKINNILRKYYNEVTDSIDFTQINNDPNSDEYKKACKDLALLGKYFDELRHTRKNIGGTNGKEIMKFIEENCDYETNTAAFTSQLSDLTRRGSNFVNLWKKVNYEFDFDGNLVRDENGKPVPNRLLYSIMKPKDSVKDKYLDKQATEDRRLIDSVYKTVNTRYYVNARNEIQLKRKELENQGKTAEAKRLFNDWFNKNHIYNPYTHKMEPLPCWVKRQYRDEILAQNNMKGEWLPKGGQREKSVKAGKRNNDYKPGLSIADNYRKGSGPANAKGIYDNRHRLNKGEEKVRDFIKETLMQTANIESARRYFKKGYLPARAKQPGLSDGKQIVKEVGKLFGFGISTNNGNKEFFNEVGYDIDETPVMPFLSQISIKDKSQVFDKPRPKRGDYPPTVDGDKLYNEAVKDWNKKKKEVDEANRKVHGENIDRDWVNVIGDYLESAGRYNAILDNKVKLYYLLDKLRTQKAFITSTRDGKNLKNDSRRGDKENPVIDSAIDNELIKQYENILKRLFFDQWKEQTGNLTKFANNLQGFTSANYMMLNFKGGIANVTLGATGILAEAAAREYFTKKEWAIGTAEWASGFISYGRAIGKDFSYSLQDAIIKTFKVVDYDEHTGIVREAEYARFSKKLRDAMFLPQTMGEHFMQNSILFAMLHSHKIVDYPEDTKGVGVTFMNEQEYIRYKEMSSLNLILNQEQLEEFNKFKEELKKDKDKLAEYAWFRKNALNRWVALHCNDKQKEEFKAARKNISEQAKEEFKKLPTMYSQFRLTNEGHLGYVTGSKLDSLDKIKMSNGITKAEKLLGDFTERTRLVNNKIHGVYNRLGSAYIEKTWIGSLVMQYHKHLPMGLMKRYAMRGHYNEIRGSVDKGMVASIIDFCSLDIDILRAKNGLTDDNISALQSVQYMFAHGLSFLMNIRETWSFTTDYDKANIKRNLGDLTGVSLAVLGALLLLMSGDDDDDSIAYNLALYECDRLASESFLYNPVGLVNEGKKLMSTPIAAQSVITDLMSAMGNTIGIILEGDDFDPYYHSGRFAGEHKLSVYIQRRIPIWNGIRGIIDIPDNNHYYKVGKNPITILPLDKIAGKEN